ncbi:MAG: hypothetical protein EXR72_06615 [Myxococcales bacterium]|nr:hypothetical protein [Myxococcales bacterium]
MTMLSNLFSRPPLAVAELREGLVVARGVVAEVLGQLELPVPLPAAAPPREQIAVAGIDIEFQPFLARPICERHERGRPFILRDPTGRALVRLAPPGPWGASGRLGDEVELRLGRPYLQGVDGERDVLLRTLAIGDEVVVAGRVHFEVDVTGKGVSSYREAPAIPVIEALALFDGPAWAQATGWHALPWYRKLSLIVCNR